MTPYRSPAQTAQRRAARDAADDAPHPALPWLKAALLAVGFGLLLAAPSARAADDAARTPGIPAEAPKRIEVAFVLDTTGSMTGLIEGAKKKIWSIAGNLLDLQPKPEIRFALIGYRDRGDDYITRRYDLSTDVQTIYARLLEFDAAGGGDTPESVNQALTEAVRDLDWSADPEVFRVVFLVGDAPPQMQYADDTPYPTTLAAAVAKDIVVNAIQAGDMRETEAVWREIARLGGGDYAQIAQDGAMVSIATPFDAEIEKIQHRLNDAVLPYGDAAQRAAVESKVAGALALAPSVASDMAGYFRKRGDDAVVTGEGDLVADLENGRVRLEALAEEALPEPMRALSPQDRAAFVAANAAERSAAQSDLDRLLEQRAAWLAANTPAETVDAFDSNVARMLSTQAAAKGFVAAK